MNQIKNELKGILALKEELEKELKESGQRFKQYKDKEDMMYYGGYNDAIRGILYKLEELLK